jgi:GST-like protein
MSDVYTPPEVWDYDPANGGQFAGINRPTAGPREEHELPVGAHSVPALLARHAQRVKATIMFEELLEKGFSDAEYDAWMIRIFAGDQFWSGFVDINPNSKIPALVDRSGPRRSACSRAGRSSSTWPRSSTTCCRRPTRRAPRRSRG